MICCSLTYLQIIVVVAHESRFIFCAFYMLLQAETLDDLQEWKTALENALALAPSATSNGNGVLKNEQGDDDNGAADESMLLF